MRRAVLDPSALLTWFDRGDAPGPTRLEYEQGLLGVVAPRELATHVLGALTTTGEWQPDQLVRIAAELDRLGFELRDPPLDEVAGWLARGLSTSQAPYAALASSLDLPLMTADPEMLLRAATVARSAADD